MITHEYQRASAATFWGGMVSLVGIGVVLAVMYGSQDGSSQAASSTAPAEPIAVPAALVKPAATGTAPGTTAAAALHNQELR